MGGEDLRVPAAPPITLGIGTARARRVTGHMMLRGNRFGLRANSSTCEVGRRLAERLELAGGVARDGKDSFAAAMIGAGSTSLPILLSSAPRERAQRAGFMASTCSASVRSLNCTNVAPCDA